MEKTGRYLLVLNRERKDQAVSKIQGITGPLPDSREFLTAEGAALSEAAVFHHIGVAVTSLDRDQAVAVQAMDDVTSVEPERYCYAIDGDDYIRGFRDGVEAFYQSAGRGTVAGSLALAEDFDESTITWGLQAIGVSRSRAAGNGARIAVLDTGLDFNHPDFTARAPIIAQSFVDGVATAQDGHGHGTHCSGTICGPSTPSVGPRYGIAPGANLFIGKVLSDQGSGTDGDILNGINWAITQKCDVISMSLGAAVAPGAPYSQAYEQAASSALEAGTLIVAAAGNESRRPGMIAPVGHPANCPSILAVAAVDDHLSVAFFSCGQIGAGKAPAIAAPGVQVYSTWPLPRRYNTISGTSMATPHVSGAAALFIEAKGVRGASLANSITSSARAVRLPHSDVGAGFLQIP